MTQLLRAQITTPGDFATPGSKYYRLSRPSDYMLSHLMRFAAEDTVRSAKWQMVLDASVKVPFLTHADSYLAARRCEALVCGTTLNVPQQNRTVGQYHADHPSVLHRSIP